MMYQIKWALEIVLQADETIETRLASMVNTLVFMNKDGSFKISRIDATGVKGSQWSDRIEDQRPLFIDANQLLDIVSEEGQIIYLEVVFTTAHFVTILLVVDGSEINVLTDEKAVASFDTVGAFKWLDLALFNHGIYEIK